MDKAEVKHNKRTLWTTLCQQTYKLGNEQIPRKHNLPKLLFLKKTGNLINSSIKKDIKTNARKSSKPIHVMIPETYIQEWSWQQGLSNTNLKNLKSHVLEWGAIAMYWSGVPLPSLEKKVR